MSGVILNTWRADLLNRLREPQIIVVLLAMTILTFIYFPAVDASYQTITLGNYRGLYNSSWMGVCLALLNLCFLTLIGFYLIRNNVERDRSQQVGELIAATQVSKFNYLMGKFLSNVSLLMIIDLFMVVVAIGLQLWLGEDTRIDLWRLLLPQLLFIFPTLCVVASIALCFESIRLLRGGIGNVFYFFLWTFSLVNFMQGVSGGNRLLNQVKAALVLVDPTNTSDMSIGIQFHDTEAGQTLNTFIWSGLNVEQPMLLSALLLVLFSPLLVTVATVLFDRFRRKVELPEMTVAPNKIAYVVGLFNGPWIRLFTTLMQALNFTRLVQQELNLMTKGRAIGWQLVMYGLGLAQLLVSPEVLFSIILPATFMGNIFVLSSLGQRESFYGAQSLVFGHRGLMSGQFPAMLVAGLMFVLLTVSPAIIHLFLVGQIMLVMNLLVGVLTIVSLALACGVLTQSSRPFEIVFTIIWYLGPLQGLVYLDFIGAHSTERNETSFVPFLLSAFILINLSIIGRIAQLKRC
jgi:hypothetical protein